jgi:hypothetical protein
VSTMVTAILALILSNFIAHLLLWQARRELRIANEALDAALARSNQYRDELTGVALANHAKFDEHAATQRAVKFNAALGTRQEICDTCFTCAPVWFMKKAPGGVFQAFSGTTIFGQGAPVRTACDHCLDGDPIPEVGESQEEYEIRRYRFRYVNPDATETEPTEKQPDPLAHPFRSLP